MASLLSPLPARDFTPRASGPTLVDLNAEPGAQPRRLFHHLLVIEPTAYLTHENARVFRAVGYAAHAARTWHQAIEWAEHEDLDAILLDLDALDASVSKLNISSTRLIILLRRVAREHPLAIAAVSCRDYVEVEDALRAGIDVFVHRQASLLCLMQRIEATRARAVARLTGKSA